MSNSTPRAVIYGIHKFGAKKLAIMLSQTDIRVMGVGDYIAGASEIENFELKPDLTEIDGKIDYLFDFVGERSVWGLAEENGAKLAIVGVNGSISMALTSPEDNLNFRIINAHGVYGAGMDGKEVDYLIAAVKLAVANKNLILPPRDQELRLLAESDLTEAVMRATFLSGTAGEMYEIWGEKTNSEALAKVLLDEAKMTRYKVIAGERVIDVPAGEIVEEVWQRLRWKPVADMAAEMTETLQYFFAKADEENRKPKQERVKEKREMVVNMEEDKLVNVTASPTVLASKPEKKFEVLIEDEVVEPPKVTPYPKVIKPVKAPEPKEEEIEDVEIEPIILKNDYKRPVKEIVEKEEVKIEKPAPTIMPVKNIQVKQVWKKINIPWGKMATAVSAIVVVALVFWGYSTYAMVRNVNSLKKLVNSRKYAEAAEVIKKTLSSVRKREAGLESWGINRFTWGRRYQEVLKATGQGLVIGEEAIAISQKAEELNDGIFKDKEIEWDKVIGELQEEVADLEGAMGVLSARLEGDWSWIPNRWRGDFNNGKKTLTEAKEITSKASQALDLLPEMLGTDGKRREYMVLLQNESEIRPNGGFIGSYGILSFENGKLLNFEINDIYEADGQLKGHVEPPEPIKNYLGEAKWFMRDANWQADFSASARDIQWFLEKETGRKVDGVIAVDLAVARGLLGVIGEVYVPDFKEKINKNNLYEQAEFYSETKFFPGSKQKASFLGALGKQLFEEIKEIKGDKRWEMVKTVIDLLERNEIQLAFNNKKTAAQAAAMGWSGSIYEGKCAVDRCFADYLYIVEANLGVNKANYFLYRSVDQTVDIGMRTIGRVVKISYENTAKNNSWPGGDYKNYLRVYIPKSANLAEVSLYDGSANATKTIISGQNLKINTVSGKKEIGVIVVIPAGQKRTVEVRYTDSVDLTNKDKFSYLHYVQKQPGFGDTGMVTLLTLPPDWQVNQVEPSASLVGDKLLFNQKLDRDIKMGVEIAK